MISDGSPPAGDAVSDELKIQFAVGGKRIIRQDLPFEIHREDLRTRQRITGDLGNAHRMNARRQIGQSQFSEQIDGTVRILLGEIPNLSIHICPEIAPRRRADIEAEIAPLMTDRQLNSGTAPVAVDTGFGGKVAYAEDPDPFGRTVQGMAHTAFPVSSGGIRK